MLVGHSLAFARNVFSFFLDKVARKCLSYKVSFDELVSFHKYDVKILKMKAKKKTDTIFSSP